MLLISSARFTHLPSWYDYPECQQWPVSIWGSSNHCGKAKNVHHWLKPWHKVTKRVKTPPSRLRPKSMQPHWAASMCAKTNKDCTFTSEEDLNITRRQSLKLKHKAEEVLSAPKPNKKWAPDSYKRKTGAYRRGRPSSTGKRILRMKYGRLIKRENVSWTNWRSPIKVLQMDSLGLILNLTLWRLEHNVWRHTCRVQTLPHRAQASIPYTVMFMNPTPNQLHHYRAKGGHAGGIEPVNDQWGIPTTNW